MFSVTLYENISLLIKEFIDEILKELMADDALNKD